MFYNIYNARKICRKEKVKEGNETSRLSQMVSVLHHVNIAFL